MKLSHISPYPLRLCVEMLYYCACHNPKTADMTVSDMVDKLSEFFTDELLEEAKRIINGHG